MDLILRCRSSPVLESIQRALEFTSWSLFTSARGRRPDTPLGPRSTDRALEGEPAGVDMSEIWEWFNSSNDRIKLRYLYHIFSLCDLELLRMVANLTSVLLVRQKQGFLPSDGECNPHWAPLDVGKGHTNFGLLILLTIII